MKRRALVLAALWLAFAAPLPTLAAPAPAGTAASVPSPVGAPPAAAQIDAAMEQLRADPALKGETTRRELRWIEQPAARTASTAPAWQRWIADFFAWLAEAGRFFAWVAGAVAIAALLWFVAGVLGERGLASAGQLDLPSHVGELDIRPDSLPEDIGAAAWALWLRDEQRAALSLLYRGALSRLVHRHRVPIQAASTEGECVALTRQHAAIAPAALFSELVAVWQRAVYGARAPQAATVQRLCREFGPVLAPPPEALDMQQSA